MPNWPRPIDSTLHGATDYTLGALLMTAVPPLRAAGAVHVAYSALTDYPLGVVKLIPYKAHLAIDALGAVALAATPFVTGSWKKGRGEWAPHVGAAAFEMLALLLSDPTQKGDFHGDVEAVRSANQESPHRKICDGRPAVAVARHG